MGNTAPQSLSPTLSDDKSVLLPVPSSLNSPRCDSLQSITFHHPFSPYASTPSAHDYTQNGFPFKSDIMSQICDCWNSYSPQKFGLHTSPELSHTIHRFAPSHINNDWLSVFGTQIIRNGDYKIWKVKIYPRRDTIEYIIKHNKYPPANVVVGIADVNSVRNDRYTKYNHCKGGFWMQPYFGYGFNGSNGKKLHQKERGKGYKRKFNQIFKVGDVITIELDLIQCNELKFSVNDKSNAVAFHVDGDKDYVLALALSDNNYDVQILS